MRRLMLTAIALLTGASSSLAQGHMGTPRATGVHARRTATLPEAVGRRQRGSAMFAAKPHEAEQELPKKYSRATECNERVPASGARSKNLACTHAPRTGNVAEDRAFQQEVVNAARALQRGPPGSGRRPGQPSADWSNRSRNEIQGWPAPPDEP